MRKYRLRFSFKGAFIFFLAFLPTIIWMIYPPSLDPIAEITAPNLLWEQVERSSQIIMVVLLITLIRKDPSIEKHVHIHLGFALVSLLGYYALWISYYAGVLAPWVYIGLAIFPTLYFLFSALWLENYLAIVPTLIFGIVHTTVTVSNFV